MEIIPKSHNELAAQALDIHYISADVGRTEEQAQAARDIFDQQRAALEEAFGTEGQPMSEDTLNKMYETAESAGIVDPSRGQGSEERKIQAHEDLSLIGDDQWVRDRLTNSGYLGQLRYERRASEERFRDPIDKFLKSRALSKEEEQEKVTKLLEKTIDIETANSEELETLKGSFPTGNFLYHGTRSVALTDILAAGNLSNIIALHEDEGRRAEAEGRERRSILRNSGYEGISWSLNQIEALPGDRYHVAGLVAAPDKIIGTDQLAVPSRPAPYEVIQISDEVDADAFYNLKTQQELFESFGFSEKNSVLGNLGALRGALRRFKEYGEFPDDAKTDYAPLMYEFLSEHDNEQVLELCHGKYEFDDDGTIRFSPDLLQQHDNELPLGVVWLQALIDSGRIDDTESFKGAVDVHEVFGKINSKNIDELTQELKKDRDNLRAQADPLDAKTGRIEVSTDEMFLVVPQKDLQTWLKVIARCKKEPKGIITYNGSAIRLENFVGDTTGDHAALTEELRKAIPARQEGTLDWEKDVLREEVSERTRAGLKHHVIAEKFLKNRRTIRLSGEELELT